MLIKFDCPKQIYALFKQNCDCSFNEFVNLCMRFYLDVHFDCFREERQKAIFKSFHDGEFQDLKKKYKTLDEYIGYLNSLRKDDELETEYTRAMKEILINHIKPHYDYDASA